MLAGASFDQLFKKLARLVGLAADLIEVGHQPENIAVFSIRQVEITRSQQIGDQLFRVCQ